MIIIRSILNRFKKKYLSLKDFFVKCAVNWISKIPPHRACVATLPCETLTSAKQTINDELQGSVV